MINVLLRYGFGKAVLKIFTQFICVLLVYIHLFRVCKKQDHLVEIVLLVVQVHNYW